MVWNSRPAAALALETHLCLVRQLRRRDSSRDVALARSSLSAALEELRLDEENAEACAENERDPRQVQEGEKRRNAAPEDERRAHEALSGRGLQPDERLSPDAL